MRVHPDDDYSFAYYEPARVAGENYVNCTRATLDRERPLKYSARTISDRGRRRLPPANSTAAPSNMNGQFTGGTGTTPAWSPTAERTVKEIISPGEVSWIETQTGRRRTEAGSRPTRRPTTRTRTGVCTPSWTTPPRSSPTASTSAPAR